MVRNTSVSNLIVQQKAQKSVDQSNSKVERFTGFLDRIMTKNDPPSDSKVDKAEKFVKDRGKGSKDPNNSFMSDMLLSGSVFMLPFLLTRGSKTNEVDPETDLKERFGGDEQLMKDQLKKEDEQRSEGLENVKSAVKKDEKVALQKRSDVDKIKEPEKDQEDPAQPDPQKDQEPIQQKGEEQAQEEKKEEVEKQKVEKTNEQRFKELVDRFAKLSKGQVFSGLAKDVVKGALNTGKKAIGKLFNFFTGIQPAAAADMSNQMQTLSNVKEVFLHDNTTIKNKTIVKNNEVKPQEDVMGKPVKKEPVYNQDLPLEERKKIIYEMAVKAGAKFPETVVAQYQLETTSGKDNIGKNNFFNLKAVEGMDYTEKVVDEYEVDGKKIQEKAKFINFDSAQDSIDYLVKLWYKDFNGYTGVETGSENSGQVAEKLQAETFATDPNYANKLKRVMKENKSLIDKIKKGEATPEEISKLELKTGFNVIEELASVEDYNEEMFGDGGGGVTFVVMNNDASSTATGGTSIPPSARRIPGQIQYVPIFDKLAVVQLHQIHALGAS